MHPPTVKAYGKSKNHQSIPLKHNPYHKRQEKATVMPCHNMRKQNTQTRPVNNCTAGTLEPCTAQVPLPLPGTQETALPGLV